MTKKLSTTAISVLLLVSALFAVVLLAPPANKAFAGTKGTALTQSLFDGAGEYTISKGGDYYLSENITGHLKVFGTGNVKVKLDLNGCTLTGADNSSTISSSGNLVITGNGGKIVQATNMTAITTDEKATYLELNNVAVESNNHSCIEGVTAAICINGGSITVKNEEGSDLASALYLTYSGTKHSYCEVNGTTLTLKKGSNIIYTGTPSAAREDKIPTLSEGTSLSSYPIQKKDDDTYKASATLKAGDTKLAMYKSKDGAYEVMKESDIPEDAKYRLYNTNFENELGDVYFEDKDQADGLKEKIGGDIEAKYAVTFKTSLSASDVYATKYAWEGKAVSAPDAPTKTDCTFGAWYQKTDKGYEEFNFDSPITSDITLYAQWKADVADVNGIFQYPTVQEAIDDAIEAGDTVNLLKSVAQSAKVGKDKDITLNLGGNTLSQPDGLEKGSGIIEATDNAKLIVTNGTMAAKTTATSPACVYVTGESADVTVKNVSMSGYYAPIHAKAGKVTVTNENGQKIEATARVDWAVYLEGTVDATITEGEFAAAGFEYGGQDLATDGCVLLKDSAKLTIKNGTFDDRVGIDGDKAELTIENGSFGRPDNASAITGGKVFLKGKSDYLYSVVTEENARIENSRYVVTDANVSPKTKVYTYKYADAENYYKYSLTGEKLSKDSTLHKMHKVQFKSQGSVVGEPLYLESLVDPYGELPEGAQLDGYTFDGWFVDSAKIAADGTTNDDQDYEVDVIAQWTKNSADGDSDQSADDADDSDDADDADDSSSKSSSDSDSDSLPDTSDPAGVIVCVALAGALAGGVRFFRRAS